MTPFVEYIKQRIPSLGSASALANRRPEDIVEAITANVVTHQSDFTRSNNNKYKYSNEDFDQLYDLLERSLGKDLASQYKNRLFYRFCNIISYENISEDLKARMLSHPEELNRTGFLAMYNDWNNLSDSVKQAVYDNPTNPNVLNLLSFAERGDHKIPAKDIEKVVPNLFNKEQMEKNGIGERGAFSTWYDAVDALLGKPYRYENVDDYRKILEQVPMNETFAHNAPVGVLEKVGMTLSPERMNDYMKSVQKLSYEKPTDAPVIPDAVKRNKNFTIDHLNSIAENYKDGNFRQSSHLFGKAPFEKAVTGLYGKSTPFLVDLSSTNGEIPPLDLPQFDSQNKNKGYLDNPTFKIQPHHTRYGLPEWMQARADDREHDGVMGAQLSDKAKQYFTEYANTLSEISPQDWNDILQMGPSDFDKVLLRVNEWNPEVFQKLIELDNKYEGEEFMKTRSGATISSDARAFGDRLRDMVHFMSDSDPKSLGRLLSVLPSFSTGSIKRSTPSIIRRPSNIGKIHNPEVFAHITNPETVDNLVKYGINREHPNFETVKPIIDASHKRLIDNDYVDPKEIHTHLATSFAETRGKTRWLMEGGLLDYFSDQKAAGHAMVKRGSATLRYLRDYLEKLKQDGVDSVDPKTLPKDKAWNSVLSSTKHQDKQGNVTEHVAIDWNPLRDPKKGGKVTLESVQKYIDSMAPKRYNLSLTTWDGAQRHSNDNSTVLNVNLSDDHVDKLKKEKLWDSYKQVTNSLPESHPQTKSTLGWIRFTEGQSENDPVFVDEIQSDLPNAIEEAVSTNSIPAEHGKKIMNILFDGVHPSEVLHEAFQEYGRKNGWVNKPMRMHSSDSKKLMSLDINRPTPVHFVRTYEDVPKKRLNAEPAAYGDHDAEKGTPFFERTTLGMSPESTNKFKRIWETKFRKTEEDSAYSDWDEDP